MDYLYQVHLADPGLIGFTYAPQHQLMFIMIIVFKSDGKGSLQAARDEFFHTIIVMCIIYYTHDMYM